MSHTSFIKTLYFHVKGEEDTKNHSVGNVAHKEMFKGNYPIVEGPYDPHFGTTDYNWSCDTCKNEKTVCPGHFGSYEPRYKLKSPLFILTQLLKWLKIICHQCGALVVTKKVSVPREKKLAKYVSLASNVTACPECKAPHYTVTKHKTEPHVFEIDTGTRKEELFNHEIAEILGRITDETVLKVGKPLVSHPRHFILSTIGIPPNTIRPDIRSLSGNRSNNSDITAFIKTIVEQNEQLPLTVPDDRESIMAGGKNSIQGKYNSLDLMYFSMLKGSSGSGNQVRTTTSTNKPPSSIAMRHPKKTGRYRKNLNGKRVWYMVRTVIVGDNYIALDEIGVPKEKIAMVIDIPEVVTEENYDRLNVYYHNGPDNYPGCHSIIQKSSGKTFSMSVHKPERYVLQVGDIVNRHMINGDTVDLNRQPSLTFSSISCHKVVVLHENDTIRLNVSSCVLYNADWTLSPIVTNSLR